jgi:hypothetical protein
MTDSLDYDVFIGYCPRDDVDGFVSGLRDAIYNDFREGVNRDEVEECSGVGLPAGAHSRTAPTSNRIPCKGRGGWIDH